jgi:hypothetical protein
MRAQFLHHPLGEEGQLRQAQFSTSRSTKVIKVGLMVQAMSLNMIVKQLLLPQGKFGEWGTRFSELSRTSLCTPDLHM